MKLNRRRQNFWPAGFLHLSLRRSPNSDQCRHEPKTLRCATCALCLPGAGGDLMGGAEERAQCSSSRPTNDGCSGAHISRSSWSQPPPLYIRQASEAVPAPREGPFSPKMKTERASCVLGAEGWLMCLAQTTHTRTHKNNRAVQTRVRTYYQKHTSRRSILWPKHERTAKTRDQTLATCLCSHGGSK